MGNVGSDKAIEVMKMQSKEKKWKQIKMQQNYVAKKPTTDEAKTVIANLQKERENEVGLIEVLRKLNVLLQSSDAQWMKKLIFDKGLDTLVQIFVSCHGPSQ